MEQEAEEDQEPGRDERGPEMGRGRQRLHQGAAQAEDYGGRGEQTTEEVRTWQAS